MNCHYGLSLHCQKLKIKKKQEWLRGTSESRVNYVVDYMYVLGSFYKSFYKYVHVL